MKGSFVLVFTVVSLLIYQRVEGLAPICKTEGATETLLECRTKWLQSAGQNFTEDCDDGLVQDFMKCTTAVEGCTNVTAFVEKSFYDYYGCLDTSITVYKRGWVRRLVCRVVCSFACSYVCSGFLPCRYVCGRVCRNVCEWVWRWVSDRFGRDVPMIAPEDSDDLTPEEIAYINGTRNMCSNCVCSIDVKNTPIDRQLEYLQPSSSVTIVGHFSLFLILSLATVAVM